MWILKQNFNTQKNKNHNAIDLIDNWKLTLLNTKEMLVLMLRNFSVCLSERQTGLGDFIHLFHKMGKKEIASTDYPYRIKYYF